MTWHPGNPDSIRRVLDYSLVPVVAAGGRGRTANASSGRWCGERCTPGLAGVAMGRKIWQSRDPVGLVRAVSAIIRHGAGVDDAMGLLTADRAS